MKTTITLGCILIAMTSDAPLLHAQGTDKTLVSWVTLTNKAIRAGSVLTIQDGDRFDGIIFAERDAHKWMAGSNNFHRTQENRDGSPEETADDKTLVQMAIVYQGDRISIYRNGEPYASYEAENIDLLSSPNNMVVFGLRHVGGDGSIAGAIEDARIYDRALTVTEIKALKPNEASSIEPYAWWDFEGKEAIERTGRYSHKSMEGGAKVQDGKLLLGRDGALAAARTEGGAFIYRRGGATVFVGPYVPDTPAWPENPPDNWPIYHLAHPTWSGPAPFDPNPALFHKGRYHLHYIYRNRAGIAFAHVSSTDMVHWKWHPTVLAPPTTGHGMFSGTGFLTRQGQPAMVYHGAGSGRNWIAYGLDDDLNEWTEPEVMLPRDEDGRLIEDVPYFDPDIWRDGDVFYGLNGVSSKDPAQIMKSKNLKDWVDLGDLLHPDFDEEKLGVSKSEDISCPNMFQLGDKWVLVCISHRLGCRYFIGDFVDEQFLPEHHALLGGNSSRYFAPESLLTPDGRRVNWAWFHGGPMKGVQSLPIELALPADGVLRIKPLRELETLRHDRRIQSDVAIKQDSPMLLDDIRGEHLELEVVVEEPTEQNFGVDVLCDDQGESGLRITVDRQDGLLEVGGETAPLVLDDDEPLRLRIFVDTTLVEVFANERQIIMTDNPRAAGAKINDRIALFTKGGDLKVDKITAWKMKAVFDGDTTY